MQKICQVFIIAILVYIVRFYDELNCQENSMFEISMSLWDINSKAMMSQYAYHECRQTTVDKGCM